MRIIKLKKMKRIQSVHFTPDGGRLLVFGGDEARMVDDAVWIDVAAGAETSRTRLFAGCYAVTPDLTRVALGEPRGDESDGEELTVAWFDFATAKKLHSVPVTVEPGEVYGVALSPDGKRLVVSFLDHPAYPTWNAPGRTDDDDSTFSVWVLGKARKPENSFVDAGSSYVLTFHPEGTHVAGSGGLDGSPQVRVFDLRDRENVLAYDPPGTQTRQLVYSPDGGTLAVVNARNVYLLPFGSTQPRLTLGGHPKQVNAVAFSPDGTRILSACHDNLVRVWDTGSGEMLHSYDWGLGAMTAITFAPDGLTAAAGGEKGQVVFWDVE